MRRYVLDTNVCLAYVRGHILYTEIENDHSLLDTYVDIDAFSQNKMHSKPLGNTPRNMGKNDLWIAATAHVSKAALITTDNDFDHLNGNFIKIFKY